VTIVCLDLEGSEIEEDKEVIKGFVYELVNDTIIILSEPSKVMVVYAVKIGRKMHIALCYIN